MKPSVEKRIIEGLENFAKALETKEDLTKRFTCRNVTLNLEPARRYGPKEVKSVRDILGASQALFAQFLGVSPSTVRAWERGEKEPMPLACRFMDEINESPDHWRARFMKKVAPKVPKRKCIEA